MYVCIDGVTANCHQIMAKIAHSTSVIYLVTGRKFGKFDI